MTGNSLLGVLRYCPYGISSEEICHQFGARPGNVRRAIHRLNQAGYIVVNLTPGGRQHARYCLVAQPGDSRTCAHPGCITILARDNYGDCCWQHSGNQTIGSTAPAWSRRAAS